MTIKKQPPIGKKARKHGPDSTHATSNKRLHLAILKQMITLATGGFGLVSALAWNNVIQEFVNSYIKPFLPKGGSIISLVIYAVLMTTLAVVVTIYLSKVIEKFEH